MDEEEKLMKYYVSMEGNSLIDALCSIDEVTGDDEYIKNLLFSELFRAPPEGIHNKINTSGYTQCLKEE